jgi:hypothetical protein
MIFNRNLLFVHVPKAGGMTITSHLLEVLPRPIYYSVPEGHSRVTGPGVIHIPGYRHENLAEARVVVARHGFDILRFPTILAAIRNPYALEVSRYAYLQKGHPWDAGHNQRLAMEECFERFAVGSVDHARPIQTYFELDGQIPPNLRVLRCERLAEDLRDTLRQVGIESRDAPPRENESSHGAYEGYYTRVAEEAVYRRYRWVFERGFYSRFDRKTFSFVQAPATTGPRLPLEGPVQQVGTASGLWPDGWVGEALRFQVRPAEPVGRIVIEGRLPYKFPGALELIVIVGDCTTRHAVGGAETFRVDVGALSEPGHSVKVLVSASATFCPRDHGLNDDGRRLSFILQRVSFHASVRESTPATVPKPTQ